MPDKIAKERRSENMRRIRSRDTGPELAVRRLLRAMGFSGYRLHRRDLPGVPDIAFIKRKKALFVHGCFWHGHDCKEGIRKPKSNVQYWLPKIERNRQRDEAHVQALAEKSWDSLTLWECELRNRNEVEERLRVFIG